MVFGKLFQKQEDNRLTLELSEMFEQSRKLEKEIREKLGGLGTRFEPLDRGRVARFRNSFIN